jgi:Zn-dependent M28 family amino/carboxypeptidase
MNLMQIVRDLEGHSNSARKGCILGYLSKLKIKYSVQKYCTGENIIVNSGREHEIGIASHFDRVTFSPGANDNASAVAVTLDVLRKYFENPPQNIGVRGFFFDEEEFSLKGSRNYVKGFGTQGLFGLYNMEMVGKGDRLAFWSEYGLERGVLYTAIKKESGKRGIKTYKIPGIRDKLGMNNSGDQQSFYEAGLAESFCITSVTGRDIHILMKQLFNPLNWINRKRVNVEKLMDESDLFRDYHKPSDSSEKLSEESMQRVSDVLYASIYRLDGVF